MISILLPVFASLLSESSTSIGKYEIKKGREGIFSFSFLNLFFIFVFLVAYFIVRPASFSFSYASLPTFSLRLILEIIQIYVTVLAITKADRTTFSFLRVITIPLLLGVDILLGYTLGFKQVTGIFILFVGVVVALIDSSVSKKYAGLIIFSAINSVITISLYKYNISHFNSFLAEQIIFVGILLFLSLAIAIIKEKKNPFKLLVKRDLFGQSFLQGAAGFIESIAYIFLPASIIVAVGRAGGVFWSTIFGRAYFKEKHIVHKLFIVCIIIVGFMFLI